MIPAFDKAASVRATETSTDSVEVAKVRSGDKGASYGESIPVMLRSFPAFTFA